MTCFVCLNVSPACPSLASTINLPQRVLKSIFEFSSLTSSVSMMRRIQYAMHIVNILFVMSLYISDVTGYCATWINSPHLVSQRIRGNVGFDKLVNINRAVGRLSMISAHGADKDEISRESAMRTISKRFPRRIQV